MNKKRRTSDLLTPEYHGVLDGVVQIMLFMETVGLRQKKERPWKVIMSQLLFIGVNMVHKEVL